MMVGLELAQGTKASLTKITQCVYAIEKHIRFEDSEPISAASLIVS